MAAEAIERRAPAQFDSGLAWLVAPLGRSRFLGEFWEQRPLTLTRHAPGYFGDLLSLDDIDRVLTANLLRVEDVQLTDAAREIGPTAYSHPSGVIDVARLFQLFADGSTIVMPQLHFRVPRLAELCRMLENELSARFQTNIYLTPGGAQGFKRHYDSHDVFILQIAGRKHWRLYDSPIALPLRGQGFRPGDAGAGAQSAAFTLEPGDVAYIPRGMMHEAESDDEMSLHITVGVLVRTWHDLFVEAMSGVSLTDDAFRRSLPTGFVKAGFDRAGARLQFSDLLRRMADHMDFDSALDRFADELVATRHPLLSDQLAQIAGLPGLTPDSIVAPRPDLLYRLQRTGEGIAIHCYGNVISLPAHAEEPIVAALAGRTAIRALPGTLDDDGKLVLVRRLVREGLLTAQ
ncbi:MAG: cupin domain-containing protein [Alphaproteobacteria bacterium]